MEGATDCGGIIGLWLASKAQSFAIAAEGGGDLMVFGGKAGDDAMLLIKRAKNGLGRVR